MAGRVVGVTLADGRRIRGVGGRRDDRHLPQRTGAHRPRAAAGWPGRRAPVDCARRVGQGSGAAVGSAEDGHAAAPAPGQHRLLAPPGGARRRSAGALLVYDAAAGPPAGQLSPAPHDAAGPRAGARANRRVPSLQRADSGHRAAVLPVARRQDHAVPRPRGAPGVPRARGPRRAGDLRQRLLDQPAARDAARPRARAAGSRAAPR